MRWEQTDSDPDRFLAVTSFSCLITAVWDDIFSTVIVAVVAGSPIGDKCEQKHVIWPLI